MTMRRSSTDIAADLIAWLNATFATNGFTFTRETALFEGGRINSIRILQIIAWVERAIGRQILDREIRMDNFASVDRIVAVFAPETTHVDG